MEILSVFKAILTPEKDQTAKDFAFLKPGDKLIGKVLAMEADGRVLIDLGRMRALAQTTLPVEVGQQLPLKVIQVGQPIQLRLDEAAAAGPQAPLPQMNPATLFSSDIQKRAAQIIDRLLAQPADHGQTLPSATTTSAVDPLSSRTPSPVQDVPGIESNLFSKQEALPALIRNALMQLKSVFEPLALDAPIAQQTQWVQEAVENRGVLFEVKLAHVFEKNAPNQTSEYRMQPPSGSMQNLSPGGPEKTAVDPQHPKADLATYAEGDPTATIALKAEQRIVLQAAAEEHQLELALQTGGSPKKQTDLPEQGRLVADPIADQPIENAVKILTRDLKPQLLILKSYFDAPDPRPAESADTQAKEMALLRQVVDRLLGHVEQQQHQAVRRAGESEVYQVFTHLLPMKDQSMPVQLKVYYPNKGGPARDDPQHRIALLLDMDQLGMVRADLSMIERHLRIQFYVRDESVQRLFADHVQTVTLALENLFDQVRIDTQVSKEKIARFEGEDLQGPPLGRIDVQA